jgi:glycosyltransferase involved in cell wall biosynthesis
MTQPDCEEPEGTDCGDRAKCAGGADRARSGATVTVLVPAYNRERYLSDAIESVLAQTYPRWKCIVIDDASTDQTREIALAYTDSDPRIEVLGLPQNRGLGLALQAGLERVATPYFVILDSDDWLSPTAVEHLYTAMEAAGDTVSLACANGVNWHESPDGQLVRGVTQRGRAFTDQYDFFQFGPNLVPRFLRTQTVREVGGFEDDPMTHGRYFEDKLLLLKLIHVSNFIYVDEDLYHIRHHGSNMTRPEARSKFIEIKRYFYERTMRAWGDEYDIEWHVHPEGWLDVKALHPKQR